MTEVELLREEVRVLKIRLGGAQLRANRYRTESQELRKELSRLGYEKRTGSNNVNVIQGQI